MKRRTPSGWWNTRSQARQTQRTVTQGIRYLRDFSAVLARVVTEAKARAVEAWLSVWRSNLTPTPPIVERKPAYTPSPLALDVLRVIRDHLVYFDGHRAGHYWSDRFMQGLVLVGGPGLSEAITRKLVEVSGGVWCITPRGAGCLIDNPPPARRRAGRGFDDTAHHAR
jgi:hypothetical protein